MTKSLRLALFIAVLAVFSGLLATLATCGGTVSKATTTTNPPQTPSSSHVVVVLLENASYSEVIGSSSMPFLNSLASQYALATNYFADAHPSIPNYFMLTAGQIVTLDDAFSGTVSDDNIVRELNNAGRSWKVYAESLPSVGYMGNDVRPYLRHHNPFVYFSDVVNSPTQQQNIVPFTQFATDLNGGSLPNYSFVAPNEFDDAHSCPTSNPGCTTADELSTADQWLQSNIGPLLNNSTFNTDGLLVIVFDESAASDVQNGGGHIAMVLAGPAVKRGFRSTTMYQHESTLRMTLQRLGVSNFPGAASSAADMSEFFTTP
jgi:phosphatidylinositol-3-phosphatase